MTLKSASNVQCFSFCFIFRMFSYGEFKAEDQVIKILIFKNLNSLLITRIHILSNMMKVASDKPCLQESNILCHNRPFRNCNFLL